MDLIEAMRTTGAVRAFTPEPVDDATVVQLLDVARHAPSGGNRQGWRVALVKDIDARRSLAALMQPVWDEYVAQSASGRTPFNVVDAPKVDGPHAHQQNPLLDAIDTVPVVLVVAADLRFLAMLDKDLDRVALVGGASVYPFCWNIMLAARAVGLGGVMTTFLSRVEPAAAPILGLPEHHAIAAVLFLGHPVHQPTRLTRRPVAEFAHLDRFDGPALG
jgi:nitroreductase